MTPIWIFPAYPLLLVAPFAANLIAGLPDAAAAARINSIAIALGAVCIQGTGFLVSLMIYSAFIYRLMTQKLPRETTRPGMVSISTQPHHILLTNHKVRFRRSIRLYSRRTRPTRQHEHLKDLTKRPFRERKRRVRHQTHFSTCRHMVMGTMPLVFPC